MALHRRRRSELDAFEFEPGVGVSVIRPARKPDHKLRMVALFGEQPEQNEGAR